MGGYPDRPYCELHEENCKTLKLIGDLELTISIRNDPETKRNNYLTIQQTRKQICEACYVTACCRAKTSKPRSS